MAYSWIERRTYWLTKSPSTSSDFLSPASQIQQLLSHISQDFLSCLINPSSNSSTFLPCRQIASTIMYMLDLKWIEMQFWKVTLPFSKVPLFLWKKLFHPTLYYWKALRNRRGLKKIVTRKLSLLPEMSIRYQQNRSLAVRNNDKDLTFFWLL